MTRGCEYAFKALERICNVPGILTTGGISPSVKGALGSHGSSRPKPLNIKLKEDPTEGVTFKSQWFAQGSYVTEFWLPQKY